MTEEQAAVLVDDSNPVFTVNASEQLNMSNANIHQLYGEVHLEPRDDVVAGSYGTWTLTYTAGEKGVATGGRIRIYTDADSDRATPQMDDPAGCRLPDDRSTASHADRRANTECTFGDIGGERSSASTGRAGGCDLWRSE